MVEITRTSGQRNNKTLWIRALFCSASIGWPLKDRTVLNKNLRLLKRQIHGFLIFLLFFTSKYNWIFSGHPVEYRVIGDTIEKNRFYVQTKIEKKKVFSFETSFFFEEIKLETLLIEFV